MFLISVLLSLLYSTNGKSVVGPTSIVSGKIVGGSPANITQAPWQVALEVDGYLFCGGSIISPNYVLTAAHCTDGSNPRYVTVRYGTSELESGGTTVQVTKIEQHPDFTQPRLDYDVAVLQLAQPITFSATAQPVILRFEEAIAGEIATVSGWGALHEGDLDLPSVLQTVNVTVVSRNSCNGPYADVITDRMVCAGDTGKDSCQIDSGGALTIANQQVGIVSWGYGCGEEGYPRVYSNVVALKEYIDQSSNNEAQWV